MKAMLVNQHGAPDVLTMSETPKPEPKPAEILVKICVAAVNHLDIWVRKGHPAYPVKLPHVLGCDGAGTVESKGAEAEGVSTGDRVLIFPGISCGTCEFCRKNLDNQCVQYEILGAKRHGTYAEYVAVPDQNVVPIPDTMSFEQAAAFPLVYVTAWHMLLNRAKLTASETVLVIGAGSGVGVASIQIAKWKGAKVLAVTTSRHKISRLKKAGADEVLLLEGNDDFSKWAAQQTGNRGVDVVVEHVGPATWEKSVKSLAKYGRLVTCGATTGPVVNLDLRYVFSRNLSLMGNRLGTQRDFRDLCEVIFKGDITPLIDKTYPLAEAASAHDYVEGKQQVGKVLLSI